LCTTAAERERGRLLDLVPFTKGTDHYKLDAFEKVKICGLLYFLWSPSSSKSGISKSIDSEGEGKGIET
jgi:hypothetical protein